MLQGPELLNLTVRDVQLPNGTIRSVIKVAHARRKPPVRCALSKASAKALGKWIAVSGKRRTDYIFRSPWRRASSSDDGPTNAPSAEILGFRGGARSQEVRHRIITTDEGCPHLEWHRRFGDGSGAVGPREDEVHSEVSTYRQKVDPIAILQRSDRADLPTCPRCGSRMQEILRITPQGADPGLIAYECPAVGHLTSVLNQH